MGRLSTIEYVASSGLPRYNNLKVIHRGSPNFIDPQLDGGNLRFAVKRGFNFSAIIPDNQAEITEDIYKNTNVIVMTARPSAMGLYTLIRLGDSEIIGELHTVRDIIDATTIEVFEPIIANYSSDLEQSSIPVVSLLGTPCLVFAPILPPDDKKIMTIDSWYKIVPSDVLLMSETPHILESLQEYVVKRADLFGIRTGNEWAGEPETVYLYHIELVTKTGLLPFVPTVGSRLYLKALPLYYREGWGEGDILIPKETGPCLLDAFYGSLLETNTVTTKLGIRTFDSFGQQINISNQQWQEIPSNHLILERPIYSDSLLFWQRITGNFQYQKNSHFIAELTDEGKFSFSSNLLVPKWPTDREYGWVIPLYSKSGFRCVVQFEPQEMQVFEIPSNVLTFIRPKVFVDSNNTPIDRIMISFKGSPNSRVEIRDWQYDGTVISSLSYFILGTNEAFGKKRWLAGGFSIKPLFYNLALLRARYSDGVSRYNAGHIYA